jgi:hypothetical protein
MATGFFEESEGNRSMGRLGFFIITIFAMLMTIGVFVWTGEYGDAIATFSTIETYAVGLKLFQNSQENNLKKEEIKKEGEVI